MPAIRESVKVLMANYGKGKVDLYLAFLRIGMDILEPGGYGMFVIPHSFLLGESAKRMRQTLSEQTWILGLIDLSAVPVFGDKSAYAVLLIFQKKKAEDVVAPPAVVAKCQESVGKMLQSVLDRRYQENENFSVYQVSQDDFQNLNWVILPPTENSLRRKYELLPSISEFLHVRQGFISAKDEVFIIPLSRYNKLPKKEKRIFVSHLKDREMRAYAVPEHSQHYFFYPYVDEDYISEAQLKLDFPETYKYLCDNEEKLQNRSLVKEGKLAWWKPAFPRHPENMMRAKIVTPHLVIVPRFSLDMNGEYAVSHSPLIYPKETGAEEDMLRFFLAVLNSRACYWHIASNSHVYQRGYALLEVNTLKKTPVPNPATVSATDKRRILDLVDQRLGLTGFEAIAVEREIDEAVAELYGLTKTERKAIGM